jgi:hypothetical protein
MANVTFLTASIASLTTAYMTLAAKSPTTRPTPTTNTNRKPSPSSMEDTVGRTAIVFELATTAKLANSKRRGTKTMQHAPTP